MGWRESRRARVGRAGAAVGMTLMRMRRAMSRAQRRGNMSSALPKGLPRARPVAGWARRAEWRTRWERAMRVRLIDGAMLRPHPRAGRPAVPAPSSGMRFWWECFVRTRIELGRTTFFGQGAHSVL